MIRFLDVMVDALWVLGLAGLFATFSYMDWYRRPRRWRWNDTWNRPRMLVPLNLSLALFSLGLALNSVTGYRPAPWWETATWGIMTVVFLWQVVIYWREGRQRGWDEAVSPSQEGESKGEG